jgi:hypothetical protein
MTYAEQIVEELRKDFEHWKMDYVRDTKLDGTQITVSFYDKHDDAVRSLSWDIYDKELNESGENHPWAVADMIRIYVNEEAEAKR